MSKKTQWSWTSAIVGAASATAAVALLSSRPKDPAFHLISINLSSFKVNFPVLDAELILNVHAFNPNVAPMDYGSTTMSIFYDGELLGTARVDAGSQAPKSCQVMRLPARLSGLRLAHHKKKFFHDVAMREMVLDAKMSVGGKARVLWWGHDVRISVDSKITVDPVFLDVIDQENKSHLELFCS